MPSKSAEMVKRLIELKMSYSREDAASKAAIIGGIRDLIISNPRLLEKYHEMLCFMQAYPDNHKILKLVDDELSSFHERVDRLRRGRRRATALDDTGIAGTTIHYPYNLRTTGWLLERFGQALDIDWEDYDDKSGDPLSGLLPLFALYVENDGIDDEDLGTVDWIRMAAGQKNLLIWLVDRLDKLGIPFETQQYIFDNAELMLKWDLGNSRGSRTLAKIPPAKTYFQRAPLKKRRIDLHETVRKGPPVLRLLTPKQAEERIETLIRALLPRHRELYPATFANPDEVYVTSPGNGLDIYFFGMLPGYRMPLESNYAALIIKNGVPIGYGISILFFDRCEIAINVFDSFRSGEASAIFEHFARLFYHHFGGRDFLMRRWQLGYENEEGIKSGSFWFYYKLGFRSLDPKTDRLAQEEWQKISADRNYRTSEKVLQKLALSDMHISRGRKSEKPYKELRVTELAFAVTRMVAGRFGGNRQKALEHALSKVHAAGLRPGRLSAGERTQFERFAPLLSLIDDLSSWRDSEKRELLRIIKAKAGTREMEYIHRLQSHRRLQAALEKIAAPA
ncbi:MAG: hypothetical protein A2W25_10665 [candidate division Zixibacteria bacterium RBG_16_53_22]|nr:MAG: hypothetical protein A2W25_10665 [candidate division Zixibacteria bacterium RBG_16_53_22]